MKKITFNFVLSTVVIVSLMSCEGKKAKDEKTIEAAQQIDSVNRQQVDNENTAKPQTTLSFESYTFAQNLKEDSFFESDQTDKEIILKNIGITSYFVSGDEVSLYGIFYDKEKNMAVPRTNNSPPGRAFVSEYFDKLEMKYDEKYKTTYSATLRITLKNPKDVKKLKMYLASEPVRNFEYKVDGTLDEYRSGFEDLVDITGKFIGLSADGIYPNKIYEIKNAEIN
jgi:hypothetical protein